MRGRALLVAVLLASACGSDDDPSIAIDDGGSSTTSTSSPGDARPQVVAPEVTPEVSPEAPSGEPTPGPTISGGGVLTPTTEADRSAVASGPPGSAAAQLLRPSPSGSLVLEVSSEEGAEPADGTLRHVANVLIDVTGKGVTIARGGAPASRDVWSSADVRAEVAALAVTPQGDPAVIRLLFVHGQHSDGDTVLGVAVNGDTVAVFVDRVRDAAVPLVGSERIETAVTTHEVGHLLGLVDLVVDRDREDPEHPGHSTNRGSVMYWAVESSLVLDLFTGGPPRDFDEADRADLAAIRAG